MPGDRQEGRCGQVGAGIKAFPRRREKQQSRPARRRQVNHEGRGPGPPTASTNPVSDRRVFLNCRIRRALRRASPNPRNAGCDGRSVREKKNENRLGNPALDFALKYGRRLWRDVLGESLGGLGGCGGVGRCREPSGTRSPARLAGPTAHTTTPKAL